MGMPRAGRPQAAGARGDWSLGGRRQEQRPTPRSCSAWPESPPEGRLKSAAWGPGTEEPLPVSSISAEAPKPVKAGAEDTMPPAAGARLASLRAYLSNKWAGRGGAVAPSGALEDSAEPR